MPRQTIADAAAELLASRRAVTSDDLGRLIAAAGLTRAKSPAQSVSRALGQDPRFRRLDDGRWIVPGQLLDGVVLTHRPTAEEIEHAALAVEPDLAPLEAVVGPGLRTTTGALLTSAWDEEARALTAVDADLALKGPPGWLGDSGQAGDPGDPDERRLLRVRLVAGRVEVSWGPEPDATARMSGRRIIETARRALEDQPGSWYLGLPPSVSLSQILLAMLADDADLLTSPSWPLGEVFEGAGLEVHRRRVGYPGTDWSELDDLMAFDDDLDAGDLDDLSRLPGERSPSAMPDRFGDIDDEGDLEDTDFETDDAVAERIAHAFGLEGDDVEALRIVLGAYDLYRRGFGLADRRLRRQLAEVMADPPIAYVLAIFAGTDEGFEPFIAELAEAAVGTDVAGPRFVLAACAEARDDVLEAERRLQAALQADSRFEPAAIELARFEVDRGRFGRALRLLRDAGVPKDDPERAWLEEVSGSAMPKVGRNEPCPCGSGRKYKVCHLGLESDGGSVEPARALLHKLWLWLEQPGSRRLRHDLMAEVVPHDTLHDPDHDEGDRLEGPIVDDVVLFDRGELERFLRVRSALLPEGEQDLIRSWLTTRRSIYEVRSVRPGKGLTVRDLLAETADGAEIELYDRSLSSQLERFDLLCLRLVTDGSGGLTPSAGLRIPRSQRARLIDIVSSGDPMALLRWIVQPNLMPQLANMEGEPLRMVDATYRVPDAAAAASALGRRLKDEGQGRFVEIIDRKGEPWIRGSITLEGDVARVQANSTKRAHRLERTLMRAAPGSRLIRHEEQGIGEAIESQRASQGDARADVERLDPAAHPDLAAALEQMMRRYEERWVDESIPALGGMTPRQALADPQQRRELEALLDDMAWQLRHSGTSGTMDPARIRAILEL